MNYYLLISSLLLVSASNVSAKLVWENFKTPKPNQVIAKATAVSKLGTPTNDLNLQQVAQLIENSERVGNSEANIGLLKKTLKQKFEQNPTVETRYLFAKVLQKEHEFDQAIEVLSHNDNQVHVNSQLLASNLLMTKGQFAEAKRRCLSLLGQTSIETVATCALDADSHSGNAYKSYKELKQVTANKPLSFNTQHVLAELALRTNNATQALNYLSDVTLATAPISLVVLWSDANLALGNVKIILQRLPALVEEHSDLEDALLLRLAMAESQLGHSNIWQSRMDARVKLREQRQDTFHASDLALYYLEISNNEEKARYWAEVNWQQAKLDQDRILLQRVNALFKDERPVAQMFTESE